MSIVEKKKGLLAAGLSRCNRDTLPVQPPVPGDGLVIGIALLPIVPADIAVPGLDIGVGELAAGMLDAGVPIVAPAGAPCRLLEQAPRAIAPPITATATTMRFIAGLPSAPK